MAKGETKAEAFRRLATQRTNAVLEKLRVLGHCANPQLYDYTEDEVKAIFRVLRKQLREVEQRFQNGKESEFRL